MKSIYMHERWGEVQEMKEEGSPETFIFETADARITYPFIRRKAGVVDGKLYYDLVTPRGECGPWLENNGRQSDEELAALFNEEFSAYCREENIVAEFIRFSAWRKEVKAFEPYYDMAFYGDVFCNDLSKDFFNEEYKSTKRRNVRKAVNHGVEIVFDTTPQSVDDFMSMYTFTEKKYEVAEYHRLSRSFIQNYWDRLPDESVFAKAYLNGKLVSAALIMLGEDIAHYHFGANHPDYLTYQANSLLFYESALYAKSRGKSYFDLGTAIAGSPLEKFKKDMAVGYPSKKAQVIRNQMIYDELVKLAGGPRENYFPAYRGGQLLPVRSL